MTALMYAAQQGYDDIVQVLVEKEAGMRDNDGKTTMMRSTKKDEIISFLSPFEAGLVDNDG